MKNKISRRDLLKAGLAGAGALTLGAGGLWFYEKPTLANRLLEEFPEEIPGARDIHKYAIKDADKTLVHVRQAHYTPIKLPLEELLYNGKFKSEEDKDIAKKIVRIYEGVSKTQRDIYAVLNHLIDNNELREVYTEGISELDEEFANINAEDVITTRISNLLNSGYFGKKYPDLPKEMLYVGGAEFMLASQDRLKLKSVENGDLNRRVYDSLSVDNDLYDIGNDIREDIALDIISKSKNPLNVLVYGGAHDFLDNIESWNSQYPDQKYSLIEVTPESYRREE